MADLRNLKGVSERDRRMIEEAEGILGPEPSEMGAAKNLFWGRVRQDLLFPYPETPAEERERCDRLLGELQKYLESEHPAIQIDQEQEIPRWVIDRLFALGVLGMTIPREHGGGGFGITSYNRVLERIGRYCGSTAVLVSAHQSIGCKAIMLFGTEEQKRKWLPALATRSLSAFCLSEPNVGCDAGGQETTCELSADGSHYILNGEKKWATSGALSDLFTVMARQKDIDKVTALVCTPEMPGVEIYQANRSKCGIRGTWQARIRFHDVRVPRENLLHVEGKGLRVALSCLDYGRCTLSAGMLGGARRAFEQAVKWAQTRHQFQRPLADFELVRAKIARMSAWCWAMDAVLYMTTGFLDRGDPDVMLETAICKVFCSEHGWRVVNDAMQIMGGEGYMTENEVERIFRDSRINLIVEGANEVMESFIFAYGGKQLEEHLLSVRQSAKDPHNLTQKAFLRTAVPLALELFAGKRGPRCRIAAVHPSLQAWADRLGKAVAEHSHQFKLASRRFGEKIVTRQCVQARLADAAMQLHAWSCVLSKLDRQVREGRRGPEWERDRRAAEYFMALAEAEARRCWRELWINQDETMLAAAEAELRYSETLPNEGYVIPERTPTPARGTGRRPRQDGIRQFPGRDAGESRAAGEVTGATEMADGAADGAAAEEGQAGSREARRNGSDPDRAARDLHMEQGTPGKTGGIDAPFDRLPR